MEMLQCPTLQGCSTEVSEGDGGVHETFFVQSFVSITVKKMTKFFQGNLLVLCNLNFYYFLSSSKHCYNRKTDFVVLVHRFIPFYTSQNKIQTLILLMNK